MTGVVIVTHEGLGEALCRQAEAILGQPPAAVTVSVPSETGSETTEADVGAALAMAADAGGVLVLTDLPGATPHNLAARAAAAIDAPLVSGINLPMLLKVLNHADRPAAELAETATTGGRQGMVRK